MISSPAIFWVVLGLVLVIAEMFSLSLVLLFFGVAALIVAVAKYLGLNNLPLEITLFAVLGIAGMFLFRKMLLKTLKTQREIGIDLNTPIVLSADLPAHGSAKVEYQGVLWTAINKTGAPLPKGSKAFVLNTDGVKIVIGPNKLEPHSS